MELLAFGDTGWGDELFKATLMTVAVALTAFSIGFIFSFIFVPLKLSKNKLFNLIGNFYTTVFRGVKINAKKKPIIIAVIATAIVIRVA